MFISRLMRPSYHHHDHFRPSSAVLIFVCVSVLWTPPVRGAANVRLCGEKLVKMVLSICNNCVHGVYMEGVQEASTAAAGVAKRSLDSAHNHQDQRTVNAEEDGWESSRSLSELDNPWSATVANQRRKRGIVDDCCLNQCSYNTLKSYCCVNTS